MTGGLYTKRIILESSGGPPEFGFAVDVSTCNVLSCIPYPTGNLKRCMTSIGSFDGACGSRVNKSL